MGNNESTVIEESTQMYSSDRHSQHIQEVYDELEQEEDRSPRISPMVDLNLRGIMYSIAQSPDRSSQTSLDIHDEVCEHQEPEEEKKTHVSPIINLNVGGIIYSIKQSKLNTIPFFDGMFPVTDHIELSFDREEVFVDRDGNLFEYIYQYLENEAYLVLPSDTFTLDRLLIEVKYYKLSEMEKIVKRKLHSAKFNHLEKQRTYTVLSMPEFNKLSSVNLECDEEQEAQTICKSYEVITTISTQEPYWVCPREISKHSSPVECGKHCKSAFHPEQHGWYFKNIDRIIVATR
ncbi:hypothetical protein BCV72DRAFT_227932 [Rhizopus microsporus var. microsporus]|uniref:Potassium channel tetramerisation-type BTB domain-containing protein n=2 Tax=Rhizopus microsporus TaxID=58291 RepID=A0A2G4T3W8_RHIZD|nr:uncharacterized protein RHIMIDRAFT_273267 [Rhizopus microsporus ATCC 52813]ORE06684.1 hypothetical protein BCV72DRAFT_227932 [Rhizopus microsporus var. microsporus]PHZ15695.1 hypothetical protein RHIMIDRAFT_273267 [Rhizopus microsporus ATCC 52813]